MMGLPRECCRELARFTREFHPSYYSLLSGLTVGAAESDEALVSAET